MTPEPWPRSHAAKVWAGKVNEATGKRNEAIRDLRAEGWSYRAIAEVVGLSHTAVRNITEKGET